MARALTAAGLLLSLLLSLSCTHDRSSWAKQLEASLAGADRLRVKASGSKKDPLARAGVLLDVKDKAQIRQLLAAIDIDEADSNAKCACYGGPTLEFSSKGKVVAIVSIQHGTALRWISGPWEADGQLTGASKRAFQAWMASHSIVNLEEWVSRSE